ncbi:MAG TPA: hypothetical protein VH328_10650 [Burkholderiaceae bacterium]|jgi:hypothetical protein|nr:hypothetical protein [Burkholderiaceae bacterium]
MLTLPRALLVAHGVADPEADAAASAHARRSERTARMVVALGLLTACATTSVLSSNADPFGARLDLHGASSRWACIDHQRVAVTADAAGFGTLPPGGRVTIGAEAPVAAAGAARCVSTLSFVPRAGQAYLTEFETSAGQCSLVVYRQVKSNRLGLGLERTQSAGQDCAEPPPSS